MTGMGEDPAGLLPEALLLAGAVVTLLVGAFRARDRQGAAGGLAVTALVSSFVFAAIAAARPDRLLYERTYALDVGTTSARLLVPAAALLSIAIARRRVAGDRRETEFYVLVLLASLGSVVLAGASDLALLAVAYLLASIPLYALAGWGRDARGAEAALKLYLLGALLGIILLLGATVLTGVGGGATGYDRLATGLASAPRAAVALGVVAVVVGLAFKAGAVPAHFWVPDTAAGATPAAAAFVTTIPKIGGVLAVTRLLLIVPEGHVNAPLLVAVLAAASMTLGNLAALAQTTARRLLGYSTISQAGYLLMAVAVAGRTPDALPALVLYLAAYSVTNLGAFAIVVAVGNGENLTDYTGLARRHPLLAAALAICLLGFVGTPPTAIFLGKLTIFSATIAGGMTWLVVVAAVNTAVSLFYYLRWLIPAFSAADPDVPANTSELEPWARAAALAGGAIALLLGPLAGPVLDAATGALTR